MPAPLSAALYAVQKGYATLLMWFAAAAEEKREGTHFVERGRRRLQRLPQ
jgi:hypothetical protein